MGQKHSATANWTMDDWAFGTGENAVQLDQVIDEARKVPTKYFGGQAVENDASMHQMQHELLSFDDTLKRIFFRRKKNKRSKKQKYSDDQYYAENQEYYDQNKQTIFEEDENQLPPIYTDRSERTIEKSLPWQCKYCTAENKSTDIECYQCKQMETEF